MHTRDSSGSCSPSPRTLVHSDLVHFDVLVAAATLSAVLDWGSSLYGAFLYDVAWLCFWRPWFPAWRGIDVSAAAAAYWRGVGVALPDHSERLLCYQLHTGLDGMADAAFTRRFDDVDAIAAHLDGLVASA